MLMLPIEVESDWNSFVTASLLRRWVAVRGSRDGPLPGMVELAAELGATSFLALALGSVFRLTEACLGRPLNLMRCCTPDLGGDASAVVHMLEDAQADGMSLVFGDAPPGLLSTLASAVASARWILTEQEMQFHAPNLDPNRPRPDRVQFAARENLQARS